jgi:DtxR family Mn-dependent transcriptional regulator
LEHVLSDELEARIDAKLGQPSTDPHGAPIPTREGTIAHSDNVRLVDVEPGQEAVVAEVGDRDPSLLRYLGELGLYPGVTVKVVARAPFNGPLTIQIGKTEEILGRTVTAHVQVTAISNSPD